MSNSVGQGSLDRLSGFRKGATGNLYYL